MNLNKIELGKKYLFKEEFCKQILEERPNVYNRKVKQFLQWLREFFIFDYKKSSPSTIIILDILKEYEMFPRYDASNRIQKRLEREATVEKFIREEVFKDSHEVCTSYSKISRDMQAKGLITEIKAPTLARGYVNPVLNRMAIKMYMVWVWNECYEDLTKDQIEEWLQLVISLMRKDKTDEEIIKEYIEIMSIEDDETRNIVIKDIKQNYYKNAIMIFRSKYGEQPIKVYKWALNAWMEEKEKK